MMKKAQLWSMDVGVALVIFLIGIIVFYTYALNYANESGSILDALTEDGTIIADALLTSGYPKDWNASSVITIGITDNNRINETKLAAFASLASSDYELTRERLNSRYDYFVNFSEPLIINNATQTHIGRQNTESTSIVRVTRLTVYNNKPALLEVHVWN